MRDLLRKAVRDESELVTLYYGDSLDERGARALIEPLEDLFPDQSFELVWGGQPLYPFIISVE
jgi:dihydroxyacetone kinase-like predicted kinase